MRHYDPKRHVIRERFEKKVGGAVLVMSLDVTNISDEEPFLGDVSVLVVEKKPDGTTLVLDFLHGRLGHREAADKAYALAMKWGVREVVAEKN